MKPDPNESIAFDECMDNFSENYQLCQLIRDESFGWSLQDANLDADPFNTPSNQALDFDLSVFDSQQSQQSDAVEWAQSWPVKPDSSISQAVWQQLVIDLASPHSKTSSGGVSLPTSLTPTLAALDFPKVPSLPDDLDYSVGRQRDLPECEEPAKFKASKFEESSKFEEFASEPVEYFQNSYPQQYPQWDYQQTGDLGSGSYVVQQPAGPGDVVTIGIYTRAERRAKIQRFRQKRERRNFSKRILYCSRKRFADSRPRVGGRFVVNENRVIKPKTFLKRGRPRKVPLLPMINCLTTNLLLE